MAAPEKTARASRAVVRIETADHEETGDPIHKLFAGNGSEIGFIEIGGFPDNCLAWGIDHETGYWRPYDYAREYSRAFNLVVADVFHLPIDPSDRDL